MGGYEPAVDDIYIDIIARAVIRSRKVEVFLDSPTATDHTYTRVSDAQVKFGKRIDNAIHELAVSRRDRLAGRTEQDVERQLREEILRRIGDGRR